ncbi:MAG: hypothetical protein FWF45_07935 [Coriobacteriia bacterium]|nr:hypothetical protein [Coriobacteriia bacterium]
MACEEQRDIHAPVVVLETMSNDDLALAKSMLASAGIPFFVKNDSAKNDPFGRGHVGWRHRGIRPLELSVAPRDVDDAYEILKSLDHPGTAALDRNDPGKRTREEEQVAIFTTSHKRELESVETRLRAAGISYSVTAKLVDRVTHVQVTVARRDVVSAKIALAMPEPSEEEAPEQAYESLPSPDSKGQSTIDGQSLDDQRSRARLLKRILIAALIILLILIFFVLPIENSLSTSQITGPTINDLPCGMLFT